MLGGAVWAPRWCDGRLRALRRSLTSHFSGRLVARSFCLYHVDAPGQEAGAADMPADYVYPDFDQLAGIVGVVLDHFAIRRCIGLGAGAGGDLLLRYAARNVARFVTL